MLLEWMRSRQKFKETEGGKSSNILKKTLFPLGFVSTIFLRSREESAVAMFTKEVWLARSKYSIKIGPASIDSEAIFLRLITKKQRFHHAFVVYSLCGDWSILIHCNRFINF